MKTQESTTIIQSFNRNDHERIDLCLTCFNGKKYFDLRIWFRTAEEAQYYPSRKGITFPAEFLPEITQTFSRLMRDYPKLENIAKQPQ